VVPNITATEPADITIGTTVGSSGAGIRSSPHRWLPGIISVAPLSSVKVFQLPYVSFPESPPRHRMLDYDHLRPYVHSQSIRWGYPTIRGRPGDAWAPLARGSIEDMVHALTTSGFSGVYVDRFGYADAGAALVSALRRLSVAEPIESNDGRMIFFDIRPAG
jgi:phosphoglycerol transferase